MQFIAPILFLEIFENQRRLRLKMDYDKPPKSENTYKKDGITYVTLDESILDTDSWLPKEAIQQVVDAIKRYEEKEIKGE